MRAREATTLGEAASCHYWNDGREGDKAPHDAPSGNRAAGCSTRLLTLLTIHACPLSSFPPKILTFPSSCLTLLGVSREFCWFGVSSSLPRMPCCLTTASNPSLYRRHRPSLAASSPCPCTLGSNSDQGSVVEVDEMAQQVEPHTHHDLMTRFDRWQAKN